MLEPNRNLTELANPDDVLSVVDYYNRIEINISNNDIQFVDSNYFVKFLELLSLDMSKNRKFSFKKAEPFLFSDSLTKYICVSCGIDIIYKETFQKLPMIQDMILNSNAIHTIDSDAFWSCPSMETLSLMNNNIKKLNELGYLNGLENLRVLNLNGNPHFSGWYNQERTFVISNDHTIYIVFKCTWCGYQNIGAFTFKYLKHLISLDVSNNKLEYINKDAFTDLRKLNYLYLINTTLKEVSFQATISQLTLSYNQLSRLDNNLLQNLPQLKFLNVSYNQIEFVEPCNKSGDQLQTLDLRNNKIKTFPTVNLIHWHTLKKLILTENHLTYNQSYTELSMTYLAKGLNSEHNFTLECKESVYFSFLQLTIMFPKYFSNCSILRTLRMDYNTQFRFIEQQIPFLVHEYLERYTCNNCNISSIYENTFEGLPNLKILELRNNNIRAWPNKVFWNNHKIEVIQLENNDFYGIDSLSIAHLFELKKLDISNNRKFSHSGELENSNLEIILCNYCLYTKIYHHTFRSLTSLRIIELKNNKIESIMKEAFENLLKLEKLDISNNGILSLNFELQNGNLEIFQCNNCSFSQIYSSTFRDLPNLRVVELKDNKIEIIADDAFEKNSKFNKLYINASKLIKIPLSLQNFLFDSGITYEKDKNNSTLVHADEVNTDCITQTNDTFYANETSVIKKDESEKMRMPGKTKESDKSYACTCAPSIILYFIIYSCLLCTYTYSNKYVLKFCGKIIKIINYKNKRRFIGYS